MDQFWDRSHELGHGIFSVFACLSCVSTSSLLLTCVWPVPFWSEMLVPTFLTLFAEAN